MRFRIAGTLAICVIAATVLSGCGESAGVTVPPGDDGLSTCTLTELSVSDLSERGAPECDLVGSTITVEELDGRFDREVIRRLPDGVPSLTISGVGATFAQGDGQGCELLVVNWGVPGVGVALIDDGELVEIWASTDEARDLHGQAVQSEGVALD